MADSEDELLIATCFGPRLRGWVSLNLLTHVLSGYEIIWKRNKYTCVPKSITWHGKIS